MTEITPALVALTYSPLVNGENPVGRIQDTAYSRFGLRDSFDGAGFNVRTYAAPLEDPSISYARLINQNAQDTTAFSERVTSLYESQNNYRDVRPGSQLDIIG